MGRHKCYQNEREKERQLGERGQSHQVEEAVGMEVFLVGSCVEKNVFLNLFQFLNLKRHLIYIKSSHGCVVCVIRVVVQRVFMMVCSCLCTEAT